MIKFFKKNDTETIRRVWECNAAGEKITVRAVIGQVSELHSLNMIFDDGVQGNENKWLVIVRSSEIYEFDTLESAKTFCKIKFN